jgi:hypothetical protein
LCLKAKARREKREQVQANKEAKSTIFLVNGEPIETVAQFKYLGRVLAEDDDDWPAIHDNITKARARWGQVAQVLTRQGTVATTMAHFYRVVVQAVLLYGSETWVITDRMWTALDSFHNRCARYISGEHNQMRPDGEWEQPATARVLQVCNLQRVEEYIEQRKRNLF